MDDASAAQVLHPPRDVQHELQQGLQRQVLMRDTNIGGQGQDRDTNRGGYHLLDF